MRDLKTRRLVVGLVAAAVIAAVLVALAVRLDLRGNMERVVAFIRGAGPLPFFAAMAVLPGLGFPLSGFLAIAGPTFGPTLGAGVVVLCAVAALSVNVTLFYWLSAHALRPLVARLVLRLGYRLPDIPPNAAWTAILVLRIVPGTPFCLQNLILGLARVPFVPYLIVSILAQVVTVAAVVTLGDAVMRGDRRAMVIGAVMIVAVGAVLHVLRKRLRPAVTAAPATGDQRN